MEPTSDSFCEVCGDTGGATRLVLCENVDAGCLGGVHLYCCVPLRSEPPSEAWYCSECQAVRKEAAAARMRAHKEREAARQQRRLELQQQRAEHKRKRQEEQETARRARQRQEEEQRRAAREAAQAPLSKALPTAGTGLPAVLRQSSGVAAVIAAASGRAAPGAPPAAGRPAAAAAPGAAARAAAGPGGAVASKDTLSFLFSSLSKEDARQQQQKEQERQRMASMLQGDERRMQGSKAEHEKLWRELAARYNLPACQAAGHCWSGTLALPVPVQDGGSFAASLTCFALPGNPQCHEAADQSLRPLAEAAAASQPLPWQFKSCKDDLGLLRPGDAWEQASMLLQVQAEPASQEARQWSSLWDYLRKSSQALAVPLPAPAAASAGGGSTDAGSAERPYLYLIPNEYEQAQKTMFGLLGLPLPEPEHPRPCSARQASGSIMRSHRPEEGDAQPLTDIRGDRSAFDRIDRSALELSKGSHYTTPTRQEAGTVRPARTPVFKSFEGQASAEADARAGPLADLHIALWGFGRSDPGIMDVLRQLRSLGAATYISVQLVNLLVVHPSLVKNNSLEAADVARDVPLGLAHLLATTDVHAYLDGRAAILNCLVGRQRLLQGGQWYAPEFSPIFPGGITAVLDYPMLATMPPDQLGQILAAMEALAAGSPDPTWIWNVAAAPADLAALQAAADRGQAPAADNWQRWQASGTARTLSAHETQLPQGAPPVSPVVQYAANVARQHMYDCRVVFLCSNDPDTQAQAEERHTILCGGVPELLHLLQEHQRRQPQQRQEWEEQQQQQRLRQQQQQQHSMLRPPEQPPPLLQKQLRRPPADFVPQPQQLPP
ncbi:PHD and RING finger domain-containing 1 isoform X3 [Chlorella sorokiniana]|uniref:PHD and RING finger domain-containing 1 isoform X3 n=1 Tax=Chlorella sorokiniana TaxID=3076 RepID=A0A2P6TER8_CHLSO|nr:PHD and RING finger domain-containing 1 isoform X3 [Chlorella sorokiniana]|eukprot:PRW21144.1 PHD and RING finger domain-containing 1 isoform X3 [Chlorella sorokiniana]